MPSRPRSPRAPRVAFVLGGGGHNGAAQVGMLQALLERDVRPDLVVGASVGALNGAAIAAEPSLGTVEKLRDVWLSVDENTIFGGSILAGAANLVRSRTHMHSNKTLRALVEGLLPFARIEDLPVRFGCVAASIERAAEHWFESGPLADAILASAAVPGVLPPIKIGDEHFVDGGIVNSIPISHAIELGASEIYVLHVGRIETALTAPQNPLQVALVAFEIARRHRFSRDLAALPDGVVAHVLPSGQPKPPTLRQLNYRNFKAVAQRIDLAYRATAGYLATTLPTAAN